MQWLAKGVRSDIMPCNKGKDESFDGVLDALIRLRSQVRVLARPLQKIPTKIDTFLPASGWQHLRPTRWGYFEQRQQGGTKAPGPHPFAVVFVTCLVHVQIVFLGKQLQQFFVRIGYPRCLESMENADQHRGEINWMCRISRQRPGNSADCRCSYWDWSGNCWNR